MSRISDEPLEQPARVVVRNLRPGDLEPVIALDAKILGTRREQFFELSLQQNLVESGVKISLAAEIDGCFVGFLLARLFYGEYGLSEPTAMLDTIGVNPDFRGQGVGWALMHQLQVNLRGLRVTSIQTQVDWNSQGLLRFLHAQGFKPAQRLCLDLELDASP